MQITCVNCGDVCEVPNEILIGLDSIDQIEPYICDACENQRDLKADEDDHECPCGCDGDDSRCVYSCLDTHLLATSEEFKHILKVRLHFALILDRDMPTKMVDLLRPYQDYLIRAVMEAQDKAAAEQARPADSLSWDCQHCENRKIGIAFTECPNCGNARG